MYTIEDLKNGKCAVINDGTVEELNKILALAKWPFEVSGSEKYYWKKFESDSSCSRKEPNLPTQSVKDFIKQLDEEENKSSKIQSLYKVGDVVTVKDKYDEGFGIDDYPAGFSIAMIKNCGNKRYKIKEVIKSPYNCTFRAYVDPFIYQLEGTPWNWSAAMFNETPSSLFLCNKNEIKEEEEYEKEFTFSEDDIPSDFPYHPYVLDQGIQERCKQEFVSPKEAFNYCTQYNIGLWFRWYNTSQEYNYWEFIYHNPKFIPENYTPKYFKEKKAQTDVINKNETVFIKLKIKQNLTIPINYAAPDLKINKPICKF